MTHASDPTLLALHSLRLKGFADSDVVATLYSQPVESTIEILEAAAAAEFVLRRDGRRSGWALTPAGRAQNERLLGEELDGLGAREQVRGAYDAFLALNGEMLATCTRWQVKDAEAQVLNDHSDAEYDAGVMKSLQALDEGVQPICHGLADRLDRFSVYSKRFTEALRKLEAGELEWFTRPIIESYHTVWFELHEDLLATLGIDRATENAPD